LYLLQEEIHHIFEAENIYPLWEELEKIREAALSGGGKDSLEPPVVSPEDEMRTLAFDVKAANRDQLAKLVEEMRARNDALEEELFKLDTRAKTLVPRVEEKLKVFEKVSN
jgi:Nnf1